MVYFSTIFCKIFQNSANYSIIASKSASICIATS